MQLVFAVGTWYSKREKAGVFERNNDMGKEIITVRQDGTGDTETISEAFARAMQIEDAVAVEIQIANGIYREKAELERDNVTLCGESATGVILDFDDYGLFLMPDGIKRGTFRSYTIYVHGTNFKAKNLTFSNSAGYGAKVGQAVALYADGARMEFEGCRFLGRQDTLFTAPLPPTVVEWGGFRGPRENAPRDNGVHYYKDCYIEGDVDFIFGGATAFFENCEICSLSRGQEVNGYVTAASTPEGREYGYVFDRCRFTSDCEPETVYLGRPWRSFAKTVIMRSELGAHIKREGWHDWNKEEAQKTAFYAEFENYGPGADAENRVAWSHQLKKEEAESYTKERVLGSE